MASPRRSKSGSIIIRKVIPKDVRAEYQRLYGQGWEAKLTIPAGTPQSDAKARAAEFLAEKQTQITAIRAANRGEGQPLSMRDARALAGQWYEWYVARHEENPGAPKYWSDLWDVLVSLMEEFAPERVLEEGWRDLEWTREPEVREGMRPLIADEARTAQFLAGRGVALDREAQALFLDCVLDEFIAAVPLLERRALGDYTPDDRPSQFPKFRRRSSVSVPAVVTPWSLFEAWVKERKPGARTISRWHSIFRDLESRFADANDITEDAAQAWAKERITPDRSPVTVRDVWLVAVRTVFEWAKGQRLVRSNPFAEVKVTVPRKISTRETDAFTPKEAMTILQASLKNDAAMSNTTAVRRWVPWLCAYSGARVSEITQLRGRDIEKRATCHAMRLTPEAGSIKGRKPRTVPLHEHLIEQGFLQFVQGRGDGPLFFDRVVKEAPEDLLNPPRSRSVMVANRLARWVRSVGVDDPEVQPNPAWRDTFKQIAERNDISERIHDAITGHAPKTVGRTYGQPTVDDMAAALKKFPRYDVSAAS